jgi:glucokinase
MSALSGGEIPVCIESDRACSILGEAWKGAARGCRNAIFVAVGTGIGAGIMADGRILRGAHGFAGAIGWMALDRPFDPRHSSCGCFEYHASGDGIAHAARQLLESAPEYRGVLSGRNVTAPDVFGAFEAGDPIASEVIKQCLEFWGMATANLVSALDPEKIVFGGGVFGPAVRFLDAIRAEAHRWAQPVSFAQVKLEASQLGADAGLCGAGYLALESTERSF